jgi:hypothetical protein
MITSCPTAAAVGRAACQGVAGRTRQFLNLSTGNPLGPEDYGSARGG